MSKRVALCGPQGPEKPEKTKHSHLTHLAQDSREVLEGQWNSTRAEALSAGLRLDLYHQGNPVFSTMSHNDSPTTNSECLHAISHLRKTKQSKTKN